MYLNREYVYVWNPYNSQKFLIKNICMYETKIYLKSSQSGIFVCMEPGYMSKVLNREHMYLWDPVHLD